MIRLLAAFQLAEHAHRCLTPDGKPQVRRYSGEPYITHPVRVAMKAAEWYSADYDADQYEQFGFRIDRHAYDPFICAAVLHDTLEDTGIDTAVIEAGCGADVLNLVQELTNPSKGSKAPRPVRKQQDRDHIAAASWLAKILKLLDRIDNLECMRGVDDDFRHLYCQESRLLLEVIGSADKKLAERLGALIVEVGGK
jgi:(p)ppGpp synthase/HD superfamily hydrolase